MSHRTSVYWSFMNEPRLKYGAMSWYSQSPVSSPSGIMIIRVNSIDLYGAIYEPISRSRKNILDYGSSELLDQVCGYWVKESVSEIKNSHKCGTTNDRWHCNTQNSAQASNTQQGATEFHFQGVELLWTFYLYSAHAKWAYWCCINYTPDRNLKNANLAQIIQTQYFPGPIAASSIMNHRLYYFLGKFTWSRESSRKVCNRSMSHGPFGGK